MTLAHFVYIPGILLLGMVIGWVLGGRAVETARADKHEKDRARAARRAREASDASDDDPRPSA
ncbi:MAG: hypothetical protein IAG13_29380 [Deltaproteobacteria bacterium]|nr:hypothetical protein [Nannocystaceae bacterium]